MGHAGWGHRNYSVTRAHRSNHRSQHFLWVDHTALSALPILTYFLLLLLLCGKDTITVSVLQVRQLRRRGQALPNVTPAGSGSTGPILTVRPMAHTLTLSTGRR
jgi:hypothetical protein